LGDLCDTCSDLDYLQVLEVTAVVVAAAAAVVVTVVIMEEETVADCFILLCITVSRSSVWWHGYHADHPKQ
jgi:hypothetical protein